MSFHVETIYIALVFVFPLSHSLTYCCARAALLTPIVRGSTNWPYISDISVSSNNYFYVAIQYDPNKHILLLYLYIKSNSKPFCYCL